MKMMNRVTTYYDEIKLCGNNIMFMRHNASSGRYYMIFLSCCFEYYLFVFNFVLENITRSNMAKIECLNRLRVVLAEKEITNRWLAEQMGVTDMTVSRWKTNKVQPSMAQFVEIAQLLKVDIKDLIEADFNYEVE